MAGAAARTRQRQARASRHTLRASRQALHHSRRSRRIIIIISSPAAAAAARRAPPWSPAALRGRRCCLKMWSCLRAGGAARSRTCAAWRSRGCRCAWGAGACVVCTCAEQGLQGRRVRARVHARVRVRVLCTRAHCIRAVCVPHARTRAARRMCAPPAARPAPHQVARHACIDHCIYRLRRAQPWCSHAHCTARALPAGRVLRRQRRVPRAWAARGRIGGGAGGAPRAAVRGVAGVPGRGSAAAGAPLQLPPLTFVVMMVITTRAAVRGVARVPGRCGAAAGARGARGRWGAWGGGVFRHERVHVCAVAAGIARCLTARLRQPRGCHRSNASAHTQPGYGRQGAHTCKC